MLRLHHPLNHLCIRADAGPSQPKPEAIVLISTCFQQQYNALGGQFFPGDGHVVSSMVSDLNKPNDIGYVNVKNTQKKCTIKYFIIKCASFTCI